jgi:hypothetical protein
MEFKNYDELKRFLDTRAARELAPVLAAAAKPLDKASFAKLQQAQFDAAKKALAEAQRARSEAIAWHDEQIDRATQRLEALKKAVEVPTVNPGKTTRPATQKTAGTKTRGPAKG